MSDSNGGWDVLSYNPSHPYWDEAIRVREVIEE